MPSSRRPSFSATRRLGALRGTIAASSRCSRSVVERVPDHQHDALGHVPVPGERLVDPVADVAHWNGPRCTLPRLTSPAKRSSSAGTGRSRTRRRSGAAGPSAAPRAERLGSTDRIGAPGSGSGSHRSSQSRLARRTSRHASKSRPRNGRSSTRAPRATERRAAHVSPRAAIASSAAGSSRPDRSPGGSPSTTDADRAAQHLVAAGLRQRGREPHRARLERRPERVADPTRAARRAARRRRRRPGASTTNTTSASPFSSSGTPTAAASTTAGCATTTVSTSAGPSRLPASLIVSSERPCRNHWPSASIDAQSPCHHTPGQRDQYVSR